MDLEKALKGELKENEVVLWNGRPRQGIQFHLVDLFLIPVGLIFMIVLIYLPLQVKFDLNGIEKMLLFLLFFVFWLYAFYVAIGRFILMKFYRENLIYAITDQRVICVKAFMGKYVEDKRIIKINTVDTSEYHGKFASVVFGRKSFMAHVFEGTGMEFLTQAEDFSITFLEIADHKVVNEVFNDAKRKLKGDGER